MDYRDVLLTSEDYIKTMTAIDDNIESKFLLSAIYTAQETNLPKTLFTETLYRSLQEKIFNKTIDEYLNTYYKDLADKVRDFLCYQTIYEIIPLINNKLSNFGVHQNSDEHIVRASKEEAKQTRDYFLGKADYFAKEIQKWLIQNQDRFEELDGMCLNAEKTVASTGLWLGGLRGKGYASSTDSVVPKAKALVEEVKTIAVNGYKENGKTFEIRPDNPKYDGIKGVDVVVDTPVESANVKYTKNGTYEVKADGKYMDKVTVEVAYPMDEDELLANELYNEIANYHLPQVLIDLRNKGLEEIPEGEQRDNFDVGTEVQMYDIAFLEICAIINNPKYDELKIYPDILNGRIDAFHFSPNMRDLPVDNDYSMYDGFDGKFKWNGSDLVINVGSKSWTGLGLYLEGYRIHFDKSYNGIPLMQLALRSRNYNSQSLSKIETYPAFSIAALGRYTKGENIKDFSNLFYNNVKLRKLPYFSATNIVYANSMFENTFSLEYEPDGLDYSNIQSGSSMMYTYAVSNSRVFGMKMKSKRIDLSNIKNAVSMFGYTKWEDGSKHQITLAQPSVNLSSAFAKASLWNNYVANVSKGADFIFNAPSGTSVNVDISNLCGEDTYGVGGLEFSDNIYIVSGFGTRLLSTHTTRLGILNMSKYTTDITSSWGTGFHYYVAPSYFEKFGGLRGIRYNVNFGQCGFSSNMIDNIINEAADLTGSDSKTMTFDSSGKVYLTNEQIARLTAKNWKLSGGQVTPETFDLPTNQNLYNISNLTQDMILETGVSSDPSKVYNISGCHYLTTVGDLEVNGTYYPSTRDSNNIPYGLKSVGNYHRKNYQLSSYPVYYIQPPFYTSLAQPDTVGNGVFDIVRGTSGADGRFDVNLMGKHIGTITINMPSDWNSGIQIRGFGGNVANIEYFGGIICEYQRLMDYSKFTKLTEQSLVDILTNLPVYRDLPKSEDTDTFNNTVKLGDANLAKLTESEIAIATDKGWVLA